MRLRRCDCCHKNIEPCTGKLFHIKRYLYRAEFEDLRGNPKVYDLCDKCAQFIEDTIKVGVKPEWLGEDA